MRKEFPYLIEGDQSYPMIDVELIGSRASLVVRALVDSGANLSLFQAEIAGYLGISIQAGQRLPVQGITGRITAYLHRIPVRVNHERFACLIAFSSELEGSLNILGRNNFFLPFLITFHERAQTVIIETERDRQ